MVKKQPPVKKASNVNEKKGKEVKKSSEREKLIIYQLFPRIFTNTNDKCQPWGTLEINGSGKFNDLKGALLKELKDLGVNCLWLTGVIEHATKSDFTKYGIEKDNPNVVKGEAGSPYAIKDYYDVDPALAENPETRMEEFEECVRRIHDAGMKVLIDFVPNHTARRYHSDVAPAGIKDFGAEDDTTKQFSPNNNYYYITNQLFSPSIPLDKEGTEPYFEFPAKATGNDCFTAFCGETDWYETVKLNYGHDYGDWSDHFNPVPDTWLKMLHILRFWASKGIDGFRCDMVFMVPLPFWHWVIPQVKKDYPSLLFIGEIYDVGQYRPFLDYGCFDYLYDKVNLYDTLVDIDIHNHSAARLTDAWQTVDGIGDSMLNFLENHDEVRYGSRAYAGDPSKVLPALVVSSMISRGPFMLYYGQELGESATENEGFAGYNDRTTIFDYWSCSTLRRWYDNGRPSERNLTSQEKWLRGVYQRVLTLCNRETAIREGAFFDLMYVNLQNRHFDPHRNFAFLRYTKTERLLIIVNFASEKRHVEVSVPELAFGMATLPIGEVKATELLSGEKYELELRPDTPVSLDIEGRGALILKF
ncbi:MAG: alpha-amylase [Bacteroides sp.]|nr:alpha-amylase [Bacteroides sp.]